MHKNSKSNYLAGKAYAQKLIFESSILPLIRLVDLLVNSLANSLVNILAKYLARSEEYSLSYK